MRQRRFSCIVLAMIMALALVPAVSHGAMSSGVLGNSGAGTLWALSAPEGVNTTVNPLGSSNPAAVTALTGWSSKDYELYLANGETATLAVTGLTSPDSYEIYVDGAPQGADTPASVDLSPGTSGFWVVVKANIGGTPEFLGIWVWPVERVNVTSGVGGSVQVLGSPTNNPGNAGPETVGSGGSRKFSYDQFDQLIVTLIPNAGYAVSSLTLNGTAVTLTHNSYNLSLSGFNVYNLSATFVSTYTFGGYVPPNLVPSNNTPPPPPAAQQQASSSANGTIAVRNTPVYDRTSSRGRKVITRLARDTEFRITGIEGNFYVVEVEGGETGYIPMGNVDAQFGKGLGATAARKAWAFDRMNARSKYRVVQFGKGDELVVLARFRNWYAFSVDGGYAFIPAKDIRLD